MAEDKIVQLQQICNRLYDKLYLGSELFAMMRAEAKKIDTAKEREKIMAFKMSMLDDEDRNDPLLLKLANDDADAQCEQSSTIGKAVMWCVEEIKRIAKFATPFDELCIEHDILYRLKQFRSNLEMLASRPITLNEFIAKLGEPVSDALIDQIFGVIRLPVPTPIMAAPAPAPVRHRPAPRRSRSATAGRSRSRRTGTPRRTATSRRRNR